MRWEDIQPDDHQEVIIRVLSRRPHGTVLAKTMTCDRPVVRVTTGTGEGQWYWPEELDPVDLIPEPRPGS